ncbi:MAG: hypothetical protein DCC43_13735 [Candidatus Brocadia sp.]|jgi:hypothetical protein|uniref:Uncharacterized protein n=1 Tax=Candidatus Brocadia fulgida TaxID=380242 RepID=A0A0M2UZD5_9BACT|nr:MAG: hypothetical protein BROFUL_00089 [Candidatus Brocadia fulgida]MCE7912990.1 hypothetical protein [Candidatus Brocadia sp. AMX3]OQY98139.1 MAG: hypothetical protein B6D35_12935 [Candidatus Brocadia sp. UTAMX2]RIJ92336.1 MAG: hypothetical protein DCC43_13735 [Candidatus Brocadia sp.]
MLLPRKGYADSATAIAEIQDNRSTCQKQWENRKKDSTREYNPPTLRMNRKTSFYPLLHFSAFPYNGLAFSDQ